MAVRWFLFETRLGELFLTLFEKTTGLAVVHADLLSEKTCGVPRTLSGG